MVYMKDDDSWSNAKKGAAMAVGAGVAGAIGLITAPIWGPVVVAAATAVSSSSVATGIAGLVGGAVANGVKPS